MYRDYQNVFGGQNLPLNIVCVCVCVHIWIKDGEGTPHYSMITRISVAMLIKTAWLTAPVEVNETRIDVSEPFLFDPVDG